MKIINIKNEIEKIEYMSTFKNFIEPNYNSCIIIGRDLKNKPILIYIEKMWNSVILNKDSSYSFDDIFPLISNFTVENQIIPSTDGSIVKIIDLSFEKEPEKEMTKEEIEETLGYKIKIV